MGLHRSQKTEILYDDILPYGLFLKADLCAEHEHGIRDLLEMFGVADPSNQSSNMDDYRISRTPENLRIEYSGDDAYLIITERARDGQNAEATLRHVGMDWSDGTLVDSCWDGSNLVIAARGDLGKLILNSIYNAFCTVQAWVFVGSRDETSGSGVLIVFDRVMRRYKEAYMALIAG